MESIFVILFQNIKIIIEIRSTKTRKKIHYLEEPSGSINNPDFYSKN